MSGDEGRAAAWHREALRLREGLDVLGVHVPRCLPGEPEDCGNNDFEHCIAYLAALKARAEVELQHTHHGEAAGVEMAERLYEHWRSEFASRYEDH